MPSQGRSNLPGATEPKAVPESAKTMFSMFAEVSRLRSFMKTRSRVRAGDQLFDWSSDQLRAAGLMGPWTLNIFESTLAGMPGAFFVWCLDIISQRQPDQSAIASVQIAEKLAGKFDPFVFPFMLMIVSSLAANASLKRKDSTPQARRRAKFAFLYFDGTYGLWAQMLGSISYTLLFDIGNRGHISTSDFLVPGIIILLAGSVWNVHNIFCVIRRRLFEVNGYSAQGRPFYQVRHKPDLNYGPRDKYFIYMLFIIPFAMKIIVYTIFILFLGIAMLIAPLTNG